MGLGKTLQSISLLAYLREGRKINGRHIVLAPKSTLGNWAKEFARWCPDIRVLRVQAQDKEERTRMVREELLPGKWDVVLTSYETLCIEANAFKRFSWYYVVSSSMGPSGGESSNRLMTLLKTRLSHDPMPIIVLACVIVVLYAGDRRGSPHQEREVSAGAHGAHAQQCLQAAADGHPPAGEEEANVPPSHF